MNDGVSDRIEARSESSPEASPRIRSSNDSHSHVKRRRHPGRVVAGVVVVLLLAALAYSLVTNPNFQWGVVAQYFTDGSVLEGLLQTLWLTVGSMLIGIVLGMVLELMRRSGNGLVRGSASAYIWLFRGTPVIVQLIFWYNLAALYPTLTLGVPFGPAFAVIDTNQLITVYVAAFLGLGLNQAAYMAEIFRAGISSVSLGQTQAGEALGLTHAMVMRKVVLPQAMRVIIPPTGNETIGMLKTTALVSVIAMPDLLYSVQIIYNGNFQPIPLLIVASLWYLIMTSLLSIAQWFIERHYGHGFTKASSATAGPFRGFTRK